MKKGKQKEKHTTHVGIDDFYKYYCFDTFKNKGKGRTVVEHDSTYALDRSTYTKILSEFNSAIAQEIMFDNLEYKVPVRMGVLSIKKKKPKIYFNENNEMVNRMPVNWKATLEMWKEDPDAKEKKKLIKHTNEHTNGYVPFWYLNTYSANFKYKTVYKFAATRTNKRSLAQILKDDNVKVNYYLK